MDRTGEIAAWYVREAVALDPVWATLAGITGFDDRMAHLTPDSFEARAELDRRTIAAVRAVAPAGKPNRAARPPRFHFHPYFTLNPTRLAPPTPRP
jgi:hypothetical protein